jgi:hypothetical protein
MVPTAKRSTHWAEHICHPFPLAAVLLLAVNDHLLKRAGVLPASITGKLSDIAGLFFFPLLLSALIRFGRGLAGQTTRDSSMAAGLSIISTAAVFAGIKLSPTFNEVVARFWGTNAQDSTDLWALFALVPSWFWMRRQHGPAMRDALQLGAVAAAGLASLATSGPVYRRNFPRWTLEPEATRELGCANGEIWFMKSGKQGAGATLQLSSREQVCRVQITKAALHLGTQAVAAAGLPISVALSNEAPTREAYLAFLFDGNDAWNAGRREGTLQLELTTNGITETWNLRVTNKLSGAQYVEDPTWYLRQR